MVRMVGLEPTRLAPLAPQASVSTNSTTSAQNQGTRYGCAGGVLRVLRRRRLQSASGVVVAGGAGTCRGRRLLRVPVLLQQARGLLRRRPPSNASARLVT